MLGDAVLGLVAEIGKGITQACQLLRPVIADREKASPRSPEMQLAARCTELARRLPDVELEMTQCIAPKPCIGLGWDIAVAVFTGPQEKHFLR
jgi:hypothetical protein